MIKTASGTDYAEIDDRGWALADTASELKARVIGLLKQSIQSGHTTLLGRVVRDGVLTPNTTPVVLDVSILEPDRLNSGDPFLSGRAKQGDLVYIDLRVISQTEVYEHSSAHGAASANRPGRRNMDDTLIPAIEKAAAANPAFADLTRDQQCNAVRNAGLEGSVDHTNPPKGWKDGAIKKRLREHYPS